MTTTPPGDQAGISPPQRSIPADTFAARLMLARMHAGNLPIREAAERCGLHYRSWSDWENGRKPRDLLAAVDLISEGLDVNADWLLFGGPLARSEENRDRWLRRNQNGAADTTARRVHMGAYVPAARKAGPPSYPAHRRRPVSRDVVDAIFAAAA